MHLLCYILKEEKCHLHSYNFDKCKKRYVRLHTTALNRLLHFVCLFCNRNSSLASDPPLKPPMKKVSNIVDTVITYG